MGNKELHGNVCLNGMVGEDSSQTIPQILTTQKLPDIISVTVQLFLIKPLKSVGLWFLSGQLSATSPETSSTQKNRSVVMV